MDIEVRVNEKTEDVLHEIARNRDYSIEMAARIVLERYAERANSEMKKAQAAIDKALNK
ncbi:hypothetical protein [Metabacillus sp. SLBN-84]